MIWAIESEGRHVRLILKKTLLLLSVTMMLMFSDWCWGGLLVKAVDKQAVGAWPGLGVGGLAWVKTAWVNAACLVIERGVVIERGLALGMVEPWAWCGLGRGSEWTTPKTIWM
jgi:hypothetical protein